MNRTTMIKTMLAATVITMMCGCSSEESLSGSSEAPLLTLSVRDQGFASSDGAKTRTTDEGTVTSFSANDAIGIYITDGTNVKFANLKYTFDGTNWTNSAYGTALPYIASGKYFAYYPYQDTYNASNVKATATTADVFFATMISGWTPAADQSTHDIYTAQDLMTAIGTSTDGYQFTFDMTHQMALVEMDLPQAHYTNSLNGTGGKYKFTFTNYQPYNVADGKYRLLVKPSSSFFILGNDDYNSTNTDNVKTWQISGTSPSAAKIKIYKVNGSSASLTTTDKENVTIGDATIGDYLYNDGTTGTTNETNTVGIVFSNEGATHGWVVSPPDKAMYGNENNGNHSDLDAWWVFQNFPDRFPKGITGSNIGTWNLPTRQQFHTIYANLYKTGRFNGQDKWTYYTRDTMWGGTAWGYLYTFVDDTNDNIQFQCGSNNHYIIGVLSF